MKIYKLLRVIMIPIIMLILAACNQTSKVEINYEFKNTIDIPVFTEKSSLDFIDEILYDPNNQLDESKITYDLNSVNLNVIGSYTVDVNYVDVNKDKLTIKVIVNVVDNEKPIVNGLKDYTLNLNSTMPNFLEGLTATDNYDGTITLSASNLDTSLVKLDTVGRYNVKLTVKDSSNNEGVFNFTVVVVDPNTNYNITFKDVLNVPQYTSNFDYNSFITSVKDVDNNNLLDQGYTIEFNLAGINTTNFGDQTLVVNLKDSNGTVVKTVNKTVTVVKQVNIVFKQDKSTTYNNTQFKPEDLIEKVVDYTGATVTLGTNYILSLDKAVDVLTLGQANYVYTIKDANQNILFTETIAITVKSSYEIVFKDTLTCLYYDTCNLNQFISGYKDMNGQSVDITTLGITLNIIGSVDTSVGGAHAVTYELKDINNKVIFTKNINITVGYNYDIEFITDLTYNTYAYRNNEFEYTDFILKITDPIGQEVTLNNQYQLLIDGQLNTHKLGTYDITYILVQGETLLCQETVTIDVVIGDYYHLISDYVFFIESDTMDSNFNYLSLLELYSWDTLIPFDSSFTYTVDIDPTMDPTIPTGYDVYLELYKDDVFITDTYLQIFLIDTQYQIIVPDVITVNSDDLTETYNIYTHVTDVKDLSNQSIAMSSCVGTDPYFELPLGSCELANGLQLVAVPFIIEEDVYTPINDYPITFFVMDYNNMLFYASKTITLKAVNEYMIEYNDLVVPQYTQNFDPTTLIKRIVDSSGVERIINQDIFVEYTGTINTTNLDEYEITFILKDANGVILYQENQEVNVDSNIYFISWNKTTFNVGEYSQDTFVPADLIKQLYLRNRYTNTYSEVTSDDYTVEYDGVIDFNQSGTYHIFINILDGQNNIIHSDSCNINIDSDYNFIFTVPSITLDINDTFDPFEYIFGVYQNGIRIDNQTGYTIAPSMTSIDTSREGDGYIIYYLKSGQDVIAEEILYYNVRSSVYLKMNDFWEIELNDPTFILDNLVAGIYDYNNNDSLVDPSLGYYYTIQSNLDITIEGLYYAEIKLYDPNNTLLITYMINLYVDSNYNVMLDTEVDISEGKTTPNELAINVYDNNNRQNITDLLGQDYNLFVEEPFDLSVPGNYTYTFVLKDSSGNVLSRFVEEIRVLDATYVAPSYVEIDVVNNGSIFITKEMTELNFDINDYVLGLYDEFGNPLDKNLFTVICENCENIDFGIAGHDYITFSVYYNPYANRPLGYQNVDLYITDGYNIILSQDLSFYLGEFTPDQLYTQILDPNGQPFTVTDHHSYDIYGSYDASIPGIYNILFGIYDVTTGSYLDIKAVQFEIVSLGDIVFDSNTTVNIDDITFKPEDLISGVYDLNSNPIEYYSNIYGKFDVRYSGDYELIYEVYDLDGHHITTEVLTITVGAYQIVLNPDHTSVLLGSTFDINSINYEVYDHLGQLIDMNTSNLSLSIETPYNTNIADTYDLSLILKNELNTIVARVQFELMVYSGYTVELNTDVDVSDGITTPNELVISIKDINNEYLYIGQDCQLRTIEPFDLSYPQQQYYTFVLTDMFDNVLTQFKIHIRVVDINYVIPENFDVIVPNDVIIISKDMTESSFNINNYVTSLVNKDTNEILPNNYYFVDYWGDFEFGTSGKYNIEISLYFTNNIYKPVFSKTVTLYIPEGYTIVPNQDLQFNINEEITFDSLVFSVLDTLGNPITMGTTYYSQDFGYDGYIPDVYQYFQIIEIKDFTSNTIYAVEIIPFEVRPLVDIVFVSKNHYDVFDPTYPGDENLVGYVNDLNGVTLPSSDYDIHITNQVYIDMSNNYNLFYSVYDKNGNLLTIEEYTVFVGEYTIDPYVSSYLVEFGNTVTLSDYDLFDHYHVMVDKYQINSADFETPIDTAYNGVHENAIIIRDDNGKIIARTPIYVQVYSNNYDPYIEDEMYTFENLLGFNPLTRIESMNSHLIGLGVVEGHYDLTTVGTYPLFYCIYEDGILVYRKAFDLVVETI